MAAGQEPLRVVVDDGTPTVLVDPDTGDVTTLNPDGGAVVHLGARQAGFGEKEEAWYANLVEKLDATDLSVITNDLIEGIKADDQSRAGWLENGAKGLDLVGLKLETPSADASSQTGDGPVMSKVRNPLMLEATLKGWANAQAELLPANGPVKVKSDGRETNQEDNDGDLLERAMNRYFTTTAVEYYPETSHMLLWGTYFQGSGFKKIYRCPLRRRPVSEKVDAKNLIVSDTSTDLRSCGRITHEIPMRPSVFKRMAMAAGYKKTSAQQPNPTPNQIDAKVSAIQGTSPIAERPEDKPYTIWESQCELDLDQFIPAKSKFKGQGIPLPYLVTIDKDNEEILSIRRDWAEEDQECNRQRMYVRYPYIPGPGFYGTGMLGLLGNSTLAMTAAWREALDTGMMANFPGGLLAKLGGRQINTDLTIGPGEWKQVETGGMPINQVVFPNPYKDVTPGLLGLIDKITEQSKALGQGAEIPAAEGVANVPVGTMLAQIEQATKVMAAAHKGMHTAQSDEIQLITDLFRRHPEDLLHAAGDILESWDGQRLLAALDNVKLVPVSDPNVPSHIHRVAKAIGLIQVISIPEFKARTDLDEAYRRILAAMREDPEGLMIPAPPAQPAQDPAGLAKLMDAETNRAKLAQKTQEMASDAQQKAAELASEQRIHEIDTTKEVIIHQADQAKVQAAEQRDRAALVAKTALEHRQQGHQERMDHAGHQLEVAKAGIEARQGEREHQLGIAKHVTDAQSQANQDAVATHQALNPPKPAAPKGKK